MKQIRPLPRLPGGKGVGVDWYAVVAKADEQAGTDTPWVEVPVTLSKSMAAEVRHGNVRAVDPKEYQVATRKHPSGPNRATLYLRRRDGA